MDANVAKCMKFHKERRWDSPGTKTYLYQIRPTADPSWFNQNSTTQQKGYTWYEATDAFWRVHCGVSHPPDGSTCNPNIHVQFLTQGGSDGEVEYGVLHPDGTFIVQDAKTFANECDWWAKNFNSQPDPPSSATSFISNMLGGSSNSLGIGISIFFIILVILFVLLLIWVMVNISRKRKSRR